MKNSKQILSIGLGLILISGIGMFSFVSAQEESQIPVWIRTAIGFWVNGELSDKELLHAIEYFVENEIIQVSSQNHDDEIFIDNLKTLQNEINLKIEHIQELIILPQIQESLVESNTAFTATGYHEELIRQVDEQWKSSDPDVPNSIAFNIIHNSASDVIRSIMDIDQKSESQFKYAEIFITNQYGANIAQSHKTSDYRQNDELWWQKAKQNGLFLSEGGFDESAGVYATAIAVRIHDDDGNFIGVVKAIINIESLNVP